MALGDARAPFLEVHRFANALVDESRRFGSTVRSRLIGCGARPDKSFANALRGLRLAKRRRSARSDIARVDSPCQARMPGLFS